MSITKFQLMNTHVRKVKHLSLQHPVSFRMCRDGLLSVPRSVMLDGIISYGGSTGTSLSLISKAFGEYYERNHFFTAVPLTSQKSLVAITAKTHREKLKSLCWAGDEEAFFHHPFSFTTVYNLFDNTPHDYLFNAISLRQVKQDIPYLLPTDSCGCASHPIKEQALYHSLMEFLERQALIGSWLSKQYRYAINPQLLREITPYTWLVEQLLENGELYIFENGNALPGYSVVMFYFSHSDQEAVQYAVGSKSGESLIGVLKSAFEELYQCYSFLYSAVFKPTNLEHKAGAGYHLAFLDYNTIQTKAIIPFLHSTTGYDLNNLSDIYALPNITYNDMLASIQQLTTAMYYYHYNDKALGLHFTKIISPDFFAHMALDKPLNLTNFYAQQLTISPDNAYLTKLPFP